MRTATRMLKKINLSCPSCSPPFLKLQRFPVGHPMDLTRPLFGQADAVAPRAASGARALTSSTTGTSQAAPPDEEPSHLTFLYMDNSKSFPVFIAYKSVKPSMDRGQRPE